MKKKAYLAWVPGITERLETGGDVSVYKTRTPGGARHLCHMAAREAGYRVAFTSVRIRRAPELDDVAFRDGIALRFIQPTL